MMQEWRLNLQTESLAELNLFEIQWSVILELLGFIRYLFCFKNLYIYMPLMGLYSDFPINENTELGQNSIS